MIGARINLLICQASLSGSFCRKVPGTPGWGQHCSADYRLTDFRDEEAEEISGEGKSYKVTGKTNADDEKYLFSCTIKDWHVTSGSTKRLSEKWSPW